MRGLALLLLLLPAAAQAQHPLEITSDVAILGDVVTTIHTLRANPFAVEGNLLMPARPTNGTVLFWGSVALAANEGLTRFLFPPKQRPYLWAAVTVLETYAILRNCHELHARMQFAF